MANWTDAVRSILGPALGEAVEEHPEILLCASDRGFDLELLEFVCRLDRAADGLDYAALDDCDVGIAQPSPPCGGSDVGIGPADRHVEQEASHLGRGLGHWDFGRSHPVFLAFVLGLIGPFGGHRDHAYRGWSARSS